MSSWLPRLVQTARESDRHPAIVLINQLRHVIPTNQFAARFGPKFTTTGGVAIRFYSSIRLQMAQVRKGYISRTAQDPFRPGKDVEISVASEHKIEADKNKVGAAFREAPVWIRYDEQLGIYGIDNIQTLLDMAVTRELVSEKKGGIFTFDEVKVKGEEAAHEFLANSPEWCERLAQGLQLDWSNYAPTSCVAETVPA
jgi:recombination protein RecA